MKDLFYLAYGSNLHPLRLSERVPSARLVEVVRLNDWQLRFHKRGRDESAKADLVRSSRSVSYGAVYRMRAEEKLLLDVFEGNGKGYHTHEFELTVEGNPRSCFLYLADGAYVDASLRPFTWYRELVRLGAEHLGFSPDYVAMIAAADAVEDPDPARCHLHDALCARIREA